MIVLSRSRSRAGVIAFALLVASSFLVGSCRGPCTAIGCESGLTVQFLVDADGGVPPMGDLDITIENQVDQAFQPLMTCTMTVHGTMQLLCDSTRAHRITPQGIVFSDTSLRRLRVTVSVDSTQIYQQSFTADYTSSEINGAGCGTCTQATIQVRLQQ